MIILKVILTHTYLHKRRKKCRKKFKNVAKLAWRLLSEICANLINYLKNILSSQHFVNRHKNAPKDFTRSRKLPFQTLVLFMINFIKGSYQDELDHFFKSLKYELLSVSFTNIRICSYGDSEDRKFDEVNTLERFVDSVGIERKKP